MQRKFQDNCDINAVQELLKILRKTQKVVLKFNHCFIFLKEGQFDKGRVASCDFYFILSLLEECIEKCSPSDVFTRFSIQSS